MTNPDFIRQLIEPYGPAIPTEALVIELNRLYHSIEAPDYDHTHPEVHQQLPPLWSQMIQEVASHSEDRSWDVLDFGCGTGFEATQLLAQLGASRIRSLTCYDPSQEMLTLCKQKIGSRLPHVRFCTNLSEVMQITGGYDLVATNSLLHHLPSPVAEIRALEPVIRSDAWWLMGHEPSRRYYGNPTCFAEFQRYSRRVKWRKLASPMACWKGFERLLSLGNSAAQATADVAHEAGLFARRPSAFAIGRLVDFNVPHSNREAAADRGFDFEEMESDLHSQWRLRWVRTYAFMGPFVETRLSREWRDRCQKLAADYPLDGANFCSVWSRT